MIDGVRIFLDDRDSFLKKTETSGIVDLKGRVNLMTGEILELPKIGAYNGLSIKITENQASIRGSLHKYYNKIEDCGEQNFNDFSYCDFKCSVAKLEKGLKFDSSKAKVTNLEFGLNIDLDFDPQKLIDNQVLMFDFKAPNRDEKFYGKGDFLEFQKTDYSIKIYNKSKHYKLKSRNILRIELKVLRSRYLQKHFGITSLDSIKRNTFKKLFEKLLEHFDNLLIVDSLFYKDTCRIDETIIFQNGINSKYWKGIRDAKTNKFVNKFKRDFYRVLESGEFLKTKSNLKNLLERKYHELMNCDYDVHRNIA